jgi:HD superfamily phosphodiesterase
LQKRSREILVFFCSCGGLGIHGFDHLGRVAILAGRLARAVGEDVESAVVMGFLHDSARKDDGRGSLHAIESAVLARKLLLEFYPQMDRGASVMPSSAMPTVKLPPTFW